MDELHKLYVVDFSARRLVYTIIVDFSNEAEARLMEQLAEKFLNARRNGQERKVANE